MHDPVMYLADRSGNRLTDAEPYEDDELTFAGSRPGIAEMFIVRCSGCDELLEVHHIGMLVLLDDEGETSFEIDLPLFPLYTKTVEIARA